MKPMVMPGIGERGTARPPRQRAAPTASAQQEASARQPPHDETPSFRELPLLRYLMRAAASLTRLRSAKGATSSFFLSNPTSACASIARCKFRNVRQHVRIAVEIGLREDVSDVRGRLLCDLGRNLDDGLVILRIGQPTRDADCILEHVDQCGAVLLDVSLMRRPDHELRRPAERVDRVEERPGQSPGSSASA